MLHRTGTAAMLVLSAVLLPASAHAGVVQLHIGGSDPSATGTLTFTGLPGESNRITVWQEPDGTVMLRDDGPRLLSGAGCTSDGREARCPGLGPDTPLQLELATSDGPDRISLDDALVYSYSYLSGGSGDDEILAGSGDDNLLGNAGNDRLEGGDGADALSGHSGADSLSGGPGIDTTDVGNSIGPITVTLDEHADDGGPGEGDRVGPDVENVSADGAGRGRVIGSDAANKLEAGDGFIDLFGAGGDDELVAPAYGKGGLLHGGPGRDTVTAGEQSMIDVRDGEADRVRCDSGLARAPVADPIDELALCVPNASVRGTIAKLLSRRRVEIRVRCGAVGQPCHTRVSLRWGPRTLARAVLDLPEGRGSAIVRLNALGREVMRARARVKAVASLQVSRPGPGGSVGPAVEAPLVVRRP